MIFAIYVILSLIFIAILYYLSIIKALLVDVLFELQEIADAVCTKEGEK